MKKLLFILITLTSLSAVAGSFVITPNTSLEFKNHWVPIISAKILGEYLILEGREQITDAQRSVKCNINIKALKELNIDPVKLGKTLVIAGKSYPYYNRERIICNKAGELEDQFEVNTASDIEIYLI